MAANGTILKALLRERHLQEHQAFCREYDRVARRVDPGLQHGYPSKTTFYRWLSGDLRKLPYPGHCRILEAMLPGWSVNDLFRIKDRTEPQLARQQRTEDSDAGESSNNTPFADLVAVFTSRSSFSYRLPPDELFNGATDICAAGLSLNLLCQQFGDRHLRSLLDDGCQVRCLFLDPHGGAIKTRENEEGYDSGLLSSLTDFNLQVLERLRAQLSEDARPRLRVHVYDEPLRFNVTIIDHRMCVAQPYLPTLRGVDSPTFVIERREEEPGLFAIFEQVVDSLWERSRPVGGSVRISAGGD